MSGVDVAQASGVGPRHLQRTTQALPPRSFPDPFEKVSGAPPRSAVGLALLLLGLDALITYGAVALLLGEDSGARLRLDTIAHIAPMAAIIGAVLGGGSVPTMIGAPVRQLVAGAAAGFGAVVMALAAVAFVAPGTTAVLVATSLLPLPPLLGLIRMGAATLLLADPQRRLFPRVVVLGNRQTASRLLRPRGDERRPIRLLGQMDDGAPLGRDPDGLRHLGPTEAIFDMIRDDMVDVVILASPWLDDCRQRDLLRRLVDRPVRVVVPVALADGRFPGCPTTSLGGLDVVVLAEGPASGWRQAAKRGIDIVGSIALGLVAIPLMLLIALAIRLDSRGPIVFRQRRTGFNDRTFTILKFRTMAFRGELDPEEERRQALRRDARVTRVGRLLRQASLDELPQLVNVFRGEMSLVGPRPHVPGTRAGDRPFEQVITRYAARHRIRPGLTGLAQVRGLRGETPTEERLAARIEADLEYIENWSLMRDAAILARTVWVVVAMTNAH